MAIKFKFNGRQVGRSYSEHARNLGARHRRAVERALTDIRNETLIRGRENIASAGKFGTRWTRGFKGSLLTTGNNYVVDFTHDVPYFSVFQEGRIIRGKPLLWIPLSFAHDAQRVRARDFPGGLFRVDRKNGGAPLLLSVRTGEPKYFGRRFVRIPKKFRVIEIIREVAGRFKQFMKARLRDG